MKKTSAFTTFIDEKYIPLDSKVKTGMVVALLLLPLVAFFFAWLQPKDAEMARLVTQKATVTRALQQAKKSAENRPKLQAELDATEKQFEITTRLLPKEKEIPSLLTNISAVGRGSGLDFLAFKPNNEVPQDFYSEIPVDIKVRGPYHNMGRFLDQISKLDRIVTVANITMGSPKKEGSEMLLNSSCRLVTYQFTNVELSKPKDKKKGRK